MVGGTVVDEDTQVTGSVDWLNGRTSCDRDRTARKLQLCADAHGHLGLVGIELEPIRGHPAGNLVDANRNIGRQSEDSDGCTTKWTLYYTMIG